MKPCGGRNWDGASGIGKLRGKKVQIALIPKEEGFRKSFEKADDLRKRTLKSIIDILSPSQAIHFLIAAFELQLRLHEWRIAKD